MLPRELRKTREPAQLLQKVITSPSPPRHPVAIAISVCARKLGGAEHPLPPWVPPKEAGEGGVWDGKCVLV